MVPRRSSQRQAGRHPFVRPEPAFSTRPGTNRATQARNTWFFRAGPARSIDAAKRRPLPLRADGSPRRGSNGNAVAAAMPSICGCPRNCERRVRAHRATGTPGKAGTGRRPASQETSHRPRSKQPQRAGCPDAQAPPPAVARCKDGPTSGFRQMSIVPDSAFAPKASCRHAARVRACSRVVAPDPAAHAEPDHDTARRPFARAARAAR